jgi:predicted AAA+ superfamily ATPase
MFPRHALETVQQALNRQAAVALIGPRQVGKTTLALSIADQTGALYLDLELPQERAKLADSALFLSAYEDRLVILDEIHRVPELFQTLRGLIDQGRRRGHRTGRFLILGSASMDLLRQSGESLAGRIEYVDLAPLDCLEAAPDLAALNCLWLRGGFPDAMLAASDADSLVWRQNFIRTYLERDVPQFGPRIPAETLGRLWTMLAHNQGTLLNAARLAAGLGVSSPTVATYIDLLVDLLLVRRLAPFCANTGKRLVKSPKVYVRDSGLVHALLGIPDYNALSGHPVVGASWEGFVIENLLAVAPLRTHASFYRTAAGAEVDLLLELPGGRAPWAIEIKRSLAPRVEKGFHSARADLAPERSLVIYPGEGGYPLAAGLEVIGLRAALAQLRSAFVASPLWASGANQPGEIT